MTKYFVWIANQAGPQAQIWHDEPKTGEGKPKFAPLTMHKLNSIEELLSLDSLILKFPLAGADNGSKIQEIS